MTAYLGTALRKRAPKGTIKGIRNCVSCDGLFENITGKKRFCSKECWPKESKICMECSKIFLAAKKNEIACSSICWKKINDTRISEKRQLQPGSIQCKECGLFVSKAIAKHLNERHDMNVKAYKLKHCMDPDSSIGIIAQSTAQKFSANFIGKKNPAYQHGGTLSPFSLKSKMYDGMSDTEKENKIKTIIESIEYVPDRRSNRIEYYLKRGLTEEEAKNALSKRQRTFTLARCIEQYGEEEGLKRWQDRQVRWHKSYKKSNYSKVSQRLFLELIENAPTCRYAERGGEHVFKTKTGSVYKLDFWVPETKHVIEFDGDYWHGTRNGTANITRNIRRDTDIIETDNDIKILHIKEKDFNMNRVETIEKCRIFLAT